MKVAAQYFPHFERLADALSQLSAQASVQSMILFAADGSDYPLDQLQALLKAQSKPLMGGIFPQIIHESNAYDQGWLLIGLGAELKVYQIDGLSDETVQFSNLIDDAVADDPLAPTYLVFVDGLAQRVSALVDGLFDVLGSESNFIGGGAGSLSFQQKPCLFSNQGVHMNAALIGALNATSHLGVGHGWTTVDADHQVTRVDKNVIQEIDHRNAFEVYSEIVNRFSETPISRENFFSIAQAFPFGINKFNGEKIVRDPISVTEDGELVCVGELVQGDFVDILSANSDQLIKAAGDTASYAFKKLNAEPASLMLMMDCISRALFLKEEFVDELKNVKSKGDADLALLGALVLGEIANSGHGYLEFYNKTTVVATLN